MIDIGKETEQYITDYLSPFLKTLYGMIGIADMLALVEVYGGRYVYIPKPANCAQHHLNSVITEQSLRIISQSWGGQRVEIPKATKLVRKLRNACIHQDYRTMTAYDLSIKYKMTIRGISKILSTDPFVKQLTNSDAQQLTLFL